METLEGEITTWHDGRKARKDSRPSFDEANEYIEQLEGKLDDIVGIARDEDEEEDVDEVDDD